jgi:hypothetical protein
MDFKAAEVALRHIEERVVTNAVGSIFVASVMSKMGHIYSLTCN